MDVLNRQTSILSVCKSVFIFNNLPSLRFGLYTYFVYPGSDKTISGRGVTTGDSPDLGSLVLLITTMREAMLWEL